MLFDFSTLVFVLLLFVVIAAFVAYIIWVATAETHAADRVAEQSTAAKAAYDSSLAKLVQDPTNSNLRQEVQALGRAYSSLTRAKNGTTHYDEDSLKTDIDAACASALNRPQRSEGQASSRLSPLR